MFIKNTISAIVNTNRDISGIVLKLLFSKKLNVNIKSIKETTDIEPEI